MMRGQCVLGSGLSVGSLRAREGYPYMTSRPIEPQSTPLASAVKRWAKKAPLGGRGQSEQALGEVRWPAHRGLEPAGL